MIEILTELEAGIEFSNEIEAIQGRGEIATRIRHFVLTPLQAAIHGYRQNQSYVDGVRIAVIGCPNVGKSSLVNRLACAERVLVSDRPGTTRDRVDVPLRIGDLPLVLSDTAGIGSSQESLDLSSMRISVECLQDCDLILFVLDAGRKIGDEEERIRRMLEQRNVLLVFNKIDLVQEAQSVKRPGSWPEWPVVKISARYDKTFDSLAEAIKGLVGPAEENAAHDDMMPNLRQCLLFEQAGQALSRAADVLEHLEEGEALAACDIKEALDCLNAASGRLIGEDTLDRIFAQFCIGK